MPAAGPNPAVVAADFVFGCAKKPRFNPVPLSLDDLALALLTAGLAIIVAGVTASLPVALPTGTVVAGAAAAAVLGAIVALLALKSLVVTAAASAGCSAQIQATRKQQCCVLYCWAPPKT